MVLIVFSFNLTASTNSLDEGIFYLKKAKRAQALQMNQSDITGYLNNAYSFFKKSNDTKAKLLQIHIGQMIEMDKEIQKTAEIIVKENRKEYIYLIDGINDLNQEEKTSLKNFILEVEEKIPFIETIALKKEVIFPYRGKKLELNFNLSQTAKISLQIDENLESTEIFNKGKNLMAINWKETFLLKESLRLGFNAVNDFSSDTKDCAIKLEVKMPDFLWYCNGIFGIHGEQYRKEKKLVKKLNSKYLWGILAGVAIGFFAYSIKENSQTGEVYTKNQRVAHGLVLGGIFTVGSLITFLKFPKKSYVPHQENIEYNKKLTKKIEEKKKEIMIKMELENK
jgi:gas vesicle protein